MKRFDPGWVNGYFVIEAEVVAGRPRPCGKTEFTCGNRRCIPSQLQCDLFNDCGDGGGLDEQDCKACKCSRVNLSNADQRSNQGRWNVPDVTTVLSRKPASPSLQIWCFVIYGNICTTMFEVCWTLRERWRRCPLSFLHIKRKSQQGLRSQKLVCNQSPVFICSFQRRCMWKENKSMWRGCNLQPDIC